MNRERGFSLLEVTIAGALVSFVVLGVSSAVLHSLHATAMLAAHEALADDALNVLSDLRAATAYDGDALARIAGRSSSASIVRDGKPVTITVSIGAADANGAAIAQVTATDALGATATEQQTLYVEAPAPGSVIDQPSPAPAPAPP